MHPTIDPARLATITHLDRSLLEQLVQAFWLRVGNHEDPDTCWEWIGWIAGNGYGRYTFRGTSYPAHRLSATIHGASIPEDMDACHTCDNRRCVNPRHIYAGTRKQNMADCTARNRHNKPVGERHWCAKLSDADVRAMRERHATGEGVNALAREFSVNSGTVSRICRRLRRMEVA
jgi:hypothetical protein